MAQLQLPESQNVECKEIWKDEFKVDLWLCKCFRRLYLYRD